MFKQVFTNTELRHYRTDHWEWGGAPGGDWRQGVSGVTVLTQKPPVVSVRKGETATMDCNLGTVTNYAAYSYKQIPGGVPQHVLRMYHDWSSPSYGSGFSAPKFTSTHQSRSDYRLIIKNVEEGDSAVYYCKTGVSNSIAQGAKTQVHVFSGSSLPPPVLTVFPPSSAELQSNTASLVCLSSQSVKFADVSWLAGGSPVSSEISTSTAVQRPDQTYQISSSLTIQTSDWNMDKVYTCKVSLGSQTLHKIIKKSECPTE
ncbi:immunoglobulin lambda-1 light chain-like [Pelmatolapia mariae]|uniref:immunoglobulin lambda-1 light chain-like n=1 Tax=Pelmatolapia mariae TaxID=158779 RepID=UPI003211E894